MLNDVTPPGWQRPKTKKMEPLEKPWAPPLHEQARAVEPSFKTPEELGGELPPLAEPTVAHHAAPKPKRFNFHKPQWPPTRKQSIIYGAAAVVLAFGIGVAWTLTHQRRTVVATPPPKVAKKVVAPTPIYSNLTGLPVADDSVNQRPVTGVMIENSTDARPQSGLDQAGVVFEAIAEGGITRFLALFQDTEPDYLGPVRSVRPYYIEWGLGFDAAIAHVGGSPEALQDMKTWNVKDLDQFYNSGAYSRISSRDAPHNVYTSLSRLRDLDAQKGYGAASYTGFARKSEQAYKAPAPAAASTKPKAAPAKPADVRTPANSIDFSISSALFSAHYDYDAASNSYKRSEGGAPHMELHADGSQVQITPKVVVAMVMQYGIQSDGKHSDYNVVSSGTAYFFQDGTVTTGQWSKASDREQIQFTGPDSKPFAFNRGQTWISAVSDQNKVSYK
jgi:hypothetical protein